MRRDEIDIEQAASTKAPSQRLPHPIRRFLPGLRM